jgi:hypothetical protein
MKVEAIIQEVEAVKDRLAAEAGGGLRRFLDEMDTWLAQHPHPGPVVNSPQELQARLRRREATEPPPPAQPYRIHDPIIADVHRIREQLCRERENAPLVLKDEPPRQP